MEEGKTGPTEPLWFSQTSQRKHFTRPPSRVIGVCCACAVVVAMQKVDLSPRSHMQWGPAGLYTLHSNLKETWELGRMGQQMGLACSYRTLKVSLQDWTSKDH